MRANFEDLRAFVHVAEQASFVRAADGLSITQSALSRRLRKLEEVVGARLLDRTSRRVGLTSVGEAFLPSARRVIRHMDRAMTDIQDFVSLRGGTVSIAGTRSVASTVLPAAIERYNAEHPGMKVRVLDGIGPGTSRFVLDGEAEFGVVLADNEPPELDVTPVLEDPYVLACRQDHPLADSPVVTWSALSGHRFVRMAPGTGNEHVLRRTLEPLGLLPEWVLEAQHLTSLMAFVERGLGVGAIPRIAVEPFRSARIAVRRLVDPVVYRHIGILEAPGRSLSPAALALRRIVFEELEQFGRDNAVDRCGGHRFRAAHFAPHEERGGDSEAAMKLRDAMHFDADRAALYLERGWWSPADTLSRWLVRAASERPEAPAIVGDGRSLSYGALAQRVAALAGGLKAIGLGSGDVVAVQLPNRAEYLMSYLAICAIGGVMTTLYVPYRAAEMESLLVHSGARAFVGLDEMGDFKVAQTVLDLQRRIATLEHVIVLGNVPDGARSFADLTTAAAHDLSDGPAAADPFLLLYTSGTSSGPKGVPLAYRGILGNARLAAAEHGITAADRILSAAPFGHLYGLYTFHVALAAGASTVLLPTFTPPDLARVLGAESVTVLFAAPAHVAACLDAGLPSAEEVASLRLAVLAGSAVLPALVKGLKERIGNGHVTQLWGMTELQAGLYTRPGDPIEIVAASAGRPSPGTEARVVGPDGATLPAGEEGELQVRGPLLFSGYLNHPKANRDAFAAGGWFRTGDFAVVGAGGNVAITGRCKDVINRGGVKYNPRDIEDLLAAHPLVDMAAIVPIPDPVLGERACCFITVAGDEAPTLEAICACLHENGVAKVRWPERLEIVDAMPLTATRKIIKGRLTEGLRGERS